MLKQVRHDKKLKISVLFLQNLCLFKTLKFVSFKLQATGGGL